MSRITGPASSVVRAISTTPKVARPSRIAAPAAAAALRTAQAAPGRPGPESLPMSKQNNNRTFHQTPASSARLDASTIDFCYMPSSSAVDAPEPDPFARIRVPLAPDNFAAQHAPEPTVRPLATPQIVVTAAKPGTVMPASLGAELDAFEYEGVKLSFVRKGGNYFSSVMDGEPAGMIRDIWTGLVDDDGGGGR